MSLFTATINRTTMDFGDQSTSAGFAELPIDFDLEKLTRFYKDGDNWIADFESLDVVEYASPSDNPSAPAREVFFVYMQRETGVYPSFGGDSAHVPLEAHAGKAQYKATQPVESQNGTFPALLHVVPVKRWFADWAMGYAGYSSVPVNTEMLAHTPPEA